MFKFLYYIFIAFIILIAICLIGSMLPIPGNFKIMVVQSGSMAPTIKTGSIVIVKPSQDYKVGDVITFGPFSKTKPSTTHRIYNIKLVDGKPVYITKGDANNAPDQREVQKKEVIGKALFSIPYLGFAVAFAKKPLGFMLLIIFPTAIIIYDEMRNIFLEVKKIKQKKNKHFSSSQKNNIEKKNSHSDNNKVVIPTVDSVRVVKKDNQKIPS